MSYASGKTGNQSQQWSTNRPFFLPDLTSPTYSAAIAQQLYQGNVGPGATVDAFAEAIKDYTKANHVLLTTSGTVALQLAIELLANTQHDGRKQMGVPAYGEIATANALSSRGHHAIPCEINTDTGCLEADWAVGVIDKLDGFVFVNFSGSTPGKDIETIRDACEATDKLFIEDAACGLGHWSEGKHAGTFGRIGTLSFSPHKLITTGQGGAILFRDEYDYRRLKSFISQGDKGKVLGANHRMSDINAALGLAQMRRISEILSQRSVQWEALAGSTPLWLPDSGYPVHNITFQKGVHGVKNYKLLSEYPFYRRYADICSNLEGAKYWADNAQYLPFGLGQ